MSLLTPLLDTGAYFTVGVEVLLSEHIQGIAKKIPEERLLTETDNPGGYAWLMKSPGKPSVLREVINKLSELRQTSSQHLEETVEKNFLNWVQEAPAIIRRYENARHSYSELDSCHENHSER